MSKLVLKTSTQYHIARSIDKTKFAQFVKSGYDENMLAEIAVDTFERASMDEVSGRAFMKDFLAVLEIIGTTSKTPIPVNTQRMKDLAYDM